MRTPSIETLTGVFNEPKEAKRIFRMSHAELCEHAAGAKRANECYHPPKTYDIRLRVLNSIEPSMYGVETINIGNEYADYLNVGETYQRTVIYWRGNYRVQSVGDFIETIERSVRKIV